MSFDVTDEEIQKHLLPALLDADFVPSRWVIDVHPSGHPTGITLHLRSGAGEEVVMEFEAPRLTDFGPFQLPRDAEAGRVFVVDISHRGWEGCTIAVGSLEEERPTYFWASSVTHVSRVRAVAEGGGP
jgi:hypothetical protein